MPKWKAIIFDMDGTLLDSEPIFLKADLAVVAAYGGFMSEEEHDGYIGIGVKEFIPIIQKKYGIEASFEEIRDFQEKTYLELARSEIAAFPEMVAFARWAKDEGYRLAIASGSTSAIIEEMTGHCGIRELFPLRVSSVEVPRGKPHPDVFLETARRMGLSPEECLVIEDSPYGVEAAYRAGMACVAVPLPTVRDEKGYLARAALLYKKGMQEFRSPSLIDYLQQSERRRA